MFVSQDRGAARKTFQKPNILRRRPKATKIRTEKNNESVDARASLCDSEIRLAPLAVPLVQSDEPNSQQFQIIEAPTFAVLSIEQIYDNNCTNTSATPEFGGDSLTIYTPSSQVSSDDISVGQTTLNVESFLNNAMQSKISSNKDVTSTSDAGGNDNIQKWCLDFDNEDSKDATRYYGDGSLVSNSKFNKSPNACDDAINRPEQESLLADNSITLEYMPVPYGKHIPKSNNNCSQRKFVCEEPGCNKSFWTEVSLEKHKKKHKGTKNLVILHCPVTKTDTNGAETKCGRTFPARNLLTKHLDEEHSAEEALFKCHKCGRRFWRAGSARAHVSGGCGRVYLCTWSGCGRVFSQPCRLREHARAHTGDRPYACLYPGCNWSFRSNSKLVRHARRHTGERRHSCAECGRSFLRREHLRDHAARHHAAPASHHACTHPDCERSFTSTASLVAHVKKVHMKQDNEGKTMNKRQKNTRAKKDTLLLTASNSKQTEDVVETTVIEPSEQISETIEVAPIETIEQDDTISQNVVLERDDGIEYEDRCARVHCTWPLQRNQEQHFALEDEAQVEQAGSESCESNIYTVRSDLFLHGNLLVNEDSEFIISRSAAECGAAGGEEARAAAPLDALVDSHPTTDLTQEELMYADAVDESSFRVFLLNGEELA